MVGPTGATFTLYVVQNAIPYIIPHMRGLVHSHPALGLNRRSSTTERLTSLGEKRKLAGALLRLLLPTA